MSFLSGYQKINKGLKLSEYLNVISLSSNNYLTKNLVNITNVTDTVASENTTVYKKAFTISTIKTTSYIDND